MTVDELNQRLEAAVSTTIRVMVDLYADELPQLKTERKPGKWIRVIDPDVNAWTGGHTCSECGRACVQMSMNYCANCGAKMKGEHT